MSIKIVNLSKPSCGTGASVGMNHRASLDQPLTLKPLGHSFIPAGMLKETERSAEGFEFAGTKK